MYAWTSNQRCGILQHWRRVLGRRFLEGFYSMTHRLLRMVFVFRGRGFLEGVLGPIKQGSWSGFVSTKMLVFNDFGVSKGGSKRGLLEGVVEPLGWGLGGEPLGCQWRGQGCFGQSWTWFLQIALYSFIGSVQSFCIYVFVQACVCLNVYQERAHIPFNVASRAVTWTTLPQHCLCYM